MSSYKDKSTNKQEQSYYYAGYDSSVSKTHSWRTVDTCCKYFKDLIKPTDSILDVGSGPGTITLDLARHVPKGTVTGIEPTKPLIDEAASNNFDNLTNVSFEVASVYALPYADCAFDIVHCHQVLIHLDDPKLALSEMKRVCKAGGIVCCKESDSEMTVMYPTLYQDSLSKFSEEQRKTINKRSDRMMGRKLKSLALDVGFKDITYSFDNWCYSSRKERKFVGDMYIQRALYSKENFHIDIEEDSQAREAVAEIWKKWIGDDRGVFIINHGEIVAHKPT